MRNICVGALILAFTIGLTASGMERPTNRPRDAAGPSEGPQGTAAGQRPQAPKDAQRQTITSTATAILVDAVVRDKNGKLVTDLSARDFEVFEDGVPQTIDSFTRVSHGAGIGVGVAWRVPERTVALNPTPPSEAPAAVPNEHPATVALVFDHLSSEALNRAQKATLAYVPLSGDSPVRIGVFAGESGPQVLQDFTTERAAVRRAVAQIPPAGVSMEEQKAERADNLTARRREIDAENARTLASAAAATGASLARNGTEIGQRETERALIQMELNMMRSFDNLDRSHKGYSAAAVLTTVIRSLSTYPGRKTIVFFSEGLPVTPSLTSRLDAVIDTANRANVTVYAVDAKGLRAESPLTAARKEMTSFVEDRTQQASLGTDRTEQPLTMAMERVEDTIRLDSRTGLAKLAEETGGFLVELSNDLTSAFRRIDEDNQFHYLLTYSPKKNVFDGRFRAIKVAVRRSGAHVFARNGYRALRAAPGPDSGDYERPALALLDRAPLPNAFPVRAAAFSFPDPARPGLSPIAVQVSTASLQFVVDDSRATYSAQASVVVRIRDGNGHQVQTLSQQYLLTGDAKDVEAAKNGQILFYREADLQPGVYTIESLVFDAAARRGSARIATLTVPGVADAALGMSSLVLVSRSEEVPSAPDGASPLRVGTMLLYPNLGEAIDNAPTRELPFFFTLYGNAAGVTASAQLLRNGAPLAEAPLPLSASSGPRVQHVGRFPIGALPAGTYELRITVGHLSRTAFFTLRSSER
jgi:VWFA-related protein